MARNSKKNAEEKEKKDEQQQVAEASKKGTKKETSEEDRQADEILKMYPQYAELYIDSKGGVFTTNTPESVRGKAKLYKNKYHK